jgi:hypothetical protein
MVKPCLAELHAQAFKNKNNSGHWPSATTGNQMLDDGRLKFSAASVSLFKTGFSLLRLCKFVCVLDKVAKRQVALGTSIFASYFMHLPSILYNLSNQKHC